MVKSTCFAWHHSINIGYVINPIVAGRLEGTLLLHPQKLSDRSDKIRIGNRRGGGNPAAPGTRFPGEDPTICETTKATQNKEPNAAGIEAPKKLSAWFIRSAVGHVRFSSVYGVVIRRNGDPAQSGTGGPVSEFKPVSAGFQSPPTFPAAVFRKRSPSSPAFMPQK
jgi:hypothetical protein